MFIDRVFLTWHSTTSLAAALPAGFASFTIVSLFMGTVQYANTFVAQYAGAKRPERIGPVIWQGAYLSIFSGIFALIPSYFSTDIFNWIGHSPEIRQEEIIYFRITCYGVGPQVLATTLSCFFSGRGQTNVVLLVNIISIVINIILDYALIFGHWGFPPMGISGAAWATNFGLLISAILFGILFFGRQHREIFATLRGWKPDIALAKRMCYYGGPNGLNFFLDIMAFTFFIFIVGKLGPVPLAATNLAFNINSLAFMPLIGCGIAVSTLVGQRIGASKPDEAEFCTWTGVHVAVGYMVLMTFLYLAIPKFFLLPFGMHATGSEFQTAYLLAEKLLRIVAIYCVSDAFYLIFTHALKGAGDTRFVMWTSLGLSWGTMVIPAYISLTFFQPGIFLLWSFICLYLILASVIFYWRFRSGTWKKMKVIEPTHLSQSSTN